MKKVSVVISVLNAVSSIEDCLISTINLSYPLMEVIIIDGGSTDGTLSIIDKYSSNIFYIKSEPDDGVYDAWNKAIKVATGDWIAFIGADDQWIDANSLTNLVGLSNNPEINFVSGKALLVDKNKISNKSIGRKFTFDELYRGMRFVHVGSIHHVNIFRDYGLFDKKYKIAGDYDYFVRNGQYINPAFFDGDIVLMGVSGLSHVHHHRVFNESFLALKNSTYFGCILGVQFLVESYIKLYTRKITLFLLKSITR